MVRLSSKGGDPVGKKNFKPIYIDYAIWSNTDDTVEKTYKLTDRQVMALQTFTEFLEWETRWDNATGWNRQQIIEWRANLENSLQWEQECGGAMDCNDIEECLPSSNEIISIKRTVQAQQNTIDNVNAQSALDAYTAAGSNIFVYNPSVPASFATDSATLEILCAVALTFTEEFARKLNNFSAFMLGLSNIVLSFGGLFAGLTAYIPSWLSSINNYVVIPIVSLVYSDYLDMQTASSDETAIQQLACQLKDRMNGVAVSYANYLSIIAGLPPVIAGSPQYTTLRDRMILYCSNEQAYLYFCDLLGLAHENPSGDDFSCYCDVAPLIFKGWDYRIAQFGSSIPASDRGFYVSGQGYAWYNGTFWDRCWVSQPTGSITARYVHVFQYRVTQQGYTTSPAIRVRVYDAIGTQIGIAEKVLWNGLTGTYDTMPYLTLDLGAVVSGIARIQVEQIALNGSLVGDYRVYALGYS